MSTSKTWLYGARVWAEWSLLPGYELYDYVGAEPLFPADNGVGTKALLHLFRHRRTGIVIGKTTMTLVGGIGSFRPFCINMERIENAAS